MRPLTHLAAALAAEGFSPPTYRTLYTLAVSARLPGVAQGDNGRWGFDPNKIEDIAQALSLTRAAARAAA